MTDGGGDEGPDEENTKPNISDKEHTTFLDVINGTGEISLKDDKIQAALPPKPKIEQLYTPYAQMYVHSIVGVPAVGINILSKKIVWSKLVIHGLDSKNS